MNISINVHQLLIRNSGCFHHQTPFPKYNIVYSKPNALNTSISFVNERVTWDFIISLYVSLC